MGLGPWITGSTMAQAASTTSCRANSVASPAMASPSSRRRRPSVRVALLGSFGYDSSIGSPFMPSPALWCAPQRDDTELGSNEAHVVPAQRRGSLKTTGGAF